MCFILGRKEGKESQVVDILSFPFPALPVFVLLCFFLYIFPVSSLHMSSKNREGS